MSARAPGLFLPGATANARLAPWAMVLAGIITLYAPSLVDSLRNATELDDTVNAVFVLGVSVWFLTLRFQQLLLAGKLKQNGTVLGGGGLLTLGLVLYVLGHTQQLPMFEVGSLIPVIAGIIALFFGWYTLRQLSVVLLLLLFLVPLPASVASDITQPVKIAVSYVAEEFLFRLGYPVARDGVILAIGQYQLLVADACSGLRSLFTLETLGLMYVTCMGHVSAMRNGLLAVVIVPISFTANTLRVVILCLIAYYFGNAASQGFLHNFSSIVLFLTALVLIIAADAAIARLMSAGTKAKATPASSADALPSLRAVLRIRLRPALIVMSAMLLAAIAAYMLKPARPEQAAIPNLEAAIPSQFGDWSIMSAAPYSQAALSPQNRDRDQPYDAVLMRSYMAQDGRRMLLALAYAGEQRQDVKIHRPEVCYPAQGFTVIERKDVDMPGINGSRPVPGSQLLVRNRERLEAVSYWIRIGDAFPRGAWQMRGKILRDGIRGKVSDGILVRASTLIEDESQAPAAYAMQQSFMADMVKATAARAPGLLVPAHTAN